LQFIQESGFGMIRLELFSRGADPLWSRASQQFSFFRRAGRLKSTEGGVPTDHGWVILDLWLRALWERRSLHFARTLLNLSADALKPR
jgi:hypothetical protein